MLNAITVPPSANSLLAVFGQWVTPVFYSMGITAENWPATVGLLTGLLAKEVVVGTLNSLYGQATALTGTLSGWHLADQLWLALKTIPQNILALKSALWNPILASAAGGSVDEGVMGQMYHRFGGTIPAFAYLLFVLLYFPCVSTTAAISREIGKGWACFSILWTTFIAYGVAVFFYQAMTWSEHRFISLLWMISISGLYLITFLLLRYFSRKEEGLSTSSLSPCQSKRVGRSFCGKHY